MIQFDIKDHADQQFSAIVENRRVTIRLRYNVSSDRWSFDLSIDDLPVLHGRRIVLGVDLLAPFNFGLGVIFAAPLTVNAVPDRDALPSGTVGLFSASESEVAQAMAS